MLNNSGSTLFDPKPLHSLNEITSRTYLDEAKGCWIWLGPQDPNGYGIANGFHYFMRQNSHSFAHRVAYCIYHNKVLDSSVLVMHECDTPLCVNPAHLKEGTHSINCKDKARRGRAGKKLTLEQVHEIREIYSRGGITQLKLAHCYNVSEMTIYNVVSRRMWAEV